MTRFAGKTAIVTGAASGIGAATAHRFADEGANVVLADLQDDAGGRVAAELGGLYRHCDVASLADWQELVREAVERFGRIDVVHNNAYTIVRGPLHELEESDWDRQLWTITKE